MKTNEDDPRVPCPKCNGLGRVDPRSLEERAAGMGLLSPRVDPEKVQCPTCEGRGLLDPPSQRHGTGEESK